MRSWFLKRRYPREIVDKEMSKVKFNLSRKIKPQVKEAKGIPLIVTYYPSLNCLSKTIRGNFYLLFINDQVKRVFSQKPVISFRSAGKLSDYLVRAKIYPIERSIGSSKFDKKHCEVCRNANKTEHFTSSVTQKTYKIDHRLN